ncbi:hypothetical protein LguiB_019809 [Lonicera macranthoides]
MVLSHTVNMVFDIKLSSVVPASARVTEGDELLQLTNMDLVMKLHYLRGLYFFNSEAVEGLDIGDFKKPMFQLLDFCYPASGRIRRSENGRPAIKCNDSGVRIAEAQCNTTIDELLAMNDQSFNDRYLTCNNALGPDLGFSPLVFVQFTRFKCGGLSVGLSWAHILGDAFSASNFINMWGQMMTGHLPRQFSNIPNAGKENPFHPPIPRKPLSLRRVDPIGDYWVTPNNSKMETHSLHVSSKQLHNLLSNFCNARPFEAISAIIWKSLAKIRVESEPRIVTICTNNSPQKGKNELSGNNQIISTVEVNFVVSSSEVSKLAKLISEEKIEENRMIEELMKRENEQLDFIVYGGGNLTFVNLEEEEIYGLELKGQKAIFANYSVNGVGDEGAVLVLPGPPKDYKIDDDGGRTVTMMLPSYQVPMLKNELKIEWGIF